MPLSKLKIETRRIRQAWIAQAAIAFFLPAAAQAGYLSTDISSPADPAFTQLLGINNAGTIAGYFGSGAAGHPNKGFQLTLPNTFTSENFPASAQTQVVGINNNGGTVGFYVDSNGITHGFLNLNGTFTNSDAPGSAFNQLLGVNNGGLAAGYSSTDPAGQVNQLAYVRQTNGAFGYLTLPSNVNSQATGINNANLVSGFYFTTATTANGFLYNLASNARTDLQFPGATSTQALGLNNAGQAVGSYLDTNGGMHGFIDVNGNFQSIDDPNGVGTTTVNGINDNGQIVGFYVNGAGNTIEFVGSSVPEPGSFVLAGLGALAFGLYRRRQH
ncbi:MAG: PEP-CTERM sorting domain-containing protein [Acidobacteriota bacterium]|nr:PEP-CTERM sorting domain-containing protein [Acidobacteriota bacterium]